MSRTGFEQLESRFTAVVGEQRAQRRAKRAPGAGRKHTLGPLRAKLFFILFYLKCAPTVDGAGLLFAVDRSRACRWGGEWLPLLEVVLGRAAVLPARQIRSVAEFLQRFPEVQDTCSSMGPNGRSSAPSRPGSNGRATRARRSATRSRM